MMLGHRSYVAPWECDQMGHMNVRFYIAKATEALASLGAALGLGPAQMRARGCGLIAVDHHIRFLREMRAGAPLSVHIGVLAADAGALRVLHEVRNDASGEVSATLVAEVAYLDLGRRTRLPLPAALRERAAAMIVPLPDHAKPRGLSDGPPRPAPTLRDAERLGLSEIYRGVVDPRDCDPFGRMAGWSFIARISDGIVHLRGTLGVEDGENGEGGPRLGSAALEYRLVFRAWPQAGDIITTRSGVRALGTKTNTYGHWLFNLETGDCIATAATVATGLDLVARKAVPLPDAVRAALQRRLVPEVTA